MSKQIYSFYSFYLFCISSEPYCYGFISPLIGRTIIRIINDISRFSHREEFEKPES